MSTEDNKALYRRFIEEVANQGRMEAVDELVAADVVEHEVLPPGIPANREGIKHLFRLFHSAFPDFHLTIEDVMADGDKVIARVRAQGTHRGEFLGIAPTGNAVAFDVIDIVRVAGGQMVEHWGIGDNLSLLQQLGAMPAPGQ